MRALLVGCVLLAGCVGNQEPRACTLIGCNDGLNVTVVSTLQQNLTVTVKSGTETLHTFTCVAGQPCMAFIDNKTPANVTVQIATPAGTTAHNYTPTYSVSRPNGPGCDPECRQATVTVNVS
jgi:hypothetical protein